MARTKRRKPAAKTKKSNSKSVQDEEEVEEPQSDDQSPGLGNVTLSKAKPAGGDAENESEHGDDDENSEEEEVDELADDGECPWHLVSGMIHSQCYKSRTHLLLPQ